MEAKDSPTEQAASELTADRPIESRHQDRLGRSQFARHLAEAIERWKENESLAIALYGEWGIGKSSIKNLVLEQLRAHGDQAPDIVEFNPWQWTGHEDLSGAFFREILAVLGGSPRSANTKALLRALRRYAAYLGLVHAFLGGPKGLVALILAVFGALSLAPPLFLKDGNALVAAKVLGWTALALAAVVFWSQQILEKLAVWIESMSPGPVSLNDHKKAVIEALRKHKRTILVVLDDVDRLTAAEIQAVFQLIKVNADFPRFVYLVMFQRNIVERALAELTKESGSTFLEKIVQVGFDVPQARQDEIDQILFEGLDRILAEDLKRLDQTYWGNVYLGALRPYFQDLRDVKRFHASLGFHINLLRTGSTLDVNPVDLIAIEALRVFEPEFYRRIRSSKALLTAHRSLDSSDRARVAEQIKELVADVQPERKSILAELVRQLFPTAAFAWGGTYYAAEIRSEWERDLRLCAPGFFDRYFQLGLSKGEISQYEVEMLLGLTSDTSGLVRELKRLAGEGRLNAALDRLDVNKDRIESRNAVSAVTALFEIGDELPEPPPGAFLGPDWTIQRIAHQALKREQAPERATKAEQILRGTSNIRMLVMMVALNSKEDERKKNPQDVLFPDAELVRLQAIAVERIRKAAAEGQLLNQRHLLHTLFRWRDWAGDEEPKRWAQTIGGSPHGALALLGAFLNKGTSQGVGDRVPKVQHSMRYTELERFLDLEAVEKQLDALADVRLSDLDQSVVHEFRKALARKRTGKPEGTFGWDDH
jgi:predicted KAP-like P-loop ATPase